MIDVKYVQAVLNALSKKFKQQRPQKKIGKTQKKYNLEVIENLQSCLEDKNLKVRVLTDNIIAFETKSFHLHFKVEANTEWKFSYIKIWEYNEDLEQKFFERF